MTDSDRAQWRARVQACATVQHPFDYPTESSVDWDDARLDAVLAEMVGRVRRPSTDAVQQAVAFLSSWALAHTAGSTHWDGCHPQHAACAANIVLRDRLVAPPPATDHALAVLGARYMRAALDDTNENDRLLGEAQDALFAWKQNPGQPKYAVDYATPQIAATVARLTGGPDA